jgi:hypothetical protein
MRKKNTFRGEVAVTAKMEAQNEKWRLKTKKNNNNKASLKKKERKKMKGETLRKKEERK